MTRVSARITALTLVYDQSLGGYALTWASGNSGSP